MKLRFFPIFLLIFILLTACGKVDTESVPTLINAENYGGLAFEPFTHDDNAVKPTKDVPLFTTETTEPFKTQSLPSDNVETSESTRGNGDPQTAPASTQATTASPQNTGQNTPPIQPPNIIPQAPPQQTTQHNDVIGVWISYIELSGILTGKSEAQFRQSYSEMLENCKTLGINTVYVHLRPFGDALYRSDYYPWSKYVTGTVGKTPAFDPLEVMLEETHSRNISFHGWINPMRIQSEGDISKVSADFPIGSWYNDDSKRNKYIVKNGSYWFLNPAYNEVIELIGNGAAEITAKYNVDGIHIDDYFYPTTATAFDADAFKASDSSVLSQFRLANCNAMVKALYASVKQGNPNALFGISPQGSIENNYEQLYADVETWCKTPGYADYIAPQFYYGFSNSAQPYIKCIGKWQEMLNNSQFGSSVKLLFGLAVYKIGTEDTWAGDGSQEWITDRQILKRQIEEARLLANYGGVIFYNYNYLFNPNHVTPAIQDEIEAVRQLTNN